VIFPWLSVELKDIPLSVAFADRSWLAAARN